MVGLKAPLDALINKLPSQMRKAEGTKGAKLRSKREERAPSCRGKNQEVGCNYQYGDNAGEISADAALAGGCEKESKHLSGRRVFSLYSPLVFGGTLVKHMPLNTPETP